MSDYYRDLNLDPAAPSPALAARLTAEIDAMPPGPDRVYREQARAILSDEGRRRFYDARLRDPAAPPWTPQELHELALAAPAPGSRVTAIVGTGARRVVVIVAAGLAALLVLLIALTSCGGDSDGGGTSATAATPGKVSPGATDSGDALRCWKYTQIEDFNLASWTSRDPSFQPSGAITLVEEYDLPANFSGMANEDWSATGMNNPAFATPQVGLTQFQDGSIGVIWQEEGPGGSSEYLGFLNWLAVVDPEDGQVTAEYDNSSASMAPKEFSLANGNSGGFHRVEAESGIEIPAAAGGTEANMNYVAAAMPDAFERSVAWVLMRGSAKLYKANYFTFSGDFAPGTPGDRSNCELLD